MKTDQSQSQIKEPKPMSTVTEVLNEAMKIEGAIGVTLVDYQSGMALGANGSGINLDVAAAGNAEVIRAKMNVMRDLGIQDSIEDILISLKKQYHLICLVESQPGLFVYLALDRGRANLAMARYKLSAVTASLKI